MTVKAYLKTAGGTYHYTITDTDIHEFISEVVYDIDTIDCMVWRGDDVLFDYKEL